jgi:uncharacterized delta-60 repeat protein
MVFVWWRGIVQRQLSGPSRESKDRRPRRLAGFRPQVEALEDRTLLAAGILDPTFGTGGLVTTNLTYTGQNSLAVQPLDGKIVVAGVATTPNVFSLARFNPDGSPDLSFGVNGVVTAQPFAPGSVDNAKALALQPDGKIVVGGDTTAGANQSNFGVERYNADGTLDTSFGNNGRVIIDFYSGDDHLSALAIQKDGRIVVAGLSGSFGTTHWALARILPDGMQDSDFDADGKIDFDFASTISNGKVSGSTDGINSIAIQPDGQIVVAGFTNVTSNLKALGANNFALGRFNALDGTLDATFGNGGLVDTDFLASPINGQVDNGNDVAYNISVLPDNRLAVAGYTQYGGGGDNFGLALYTTNGQLDKTFNTNGVVATDFSTNFTSGSLGSGDVEDRAFSIAQQPDGKFILAGFSTRLGQNNFALLRYNADGSLDQNFGQHGEVVTAFTPTSVDQATNLVLQPNGAILLAGTSNQGGGPHFAMARYAGIQAGNVQFSASAYSAAENSGTAVITVTRVGGSDGTVTVNYATSNGTAVAGTDYTAVSGTLTFTAGQTTQTFTVSLKDDGIFQLTNKTINLTLSSPTGGGLLGIPSTAVLTELESDGPNNVQFSAASYSVPENGGSITITVTRNSSAGSVSVNFATSNGTAVAGTDFTSSSGTLTFAAGQSTATFTVAVQDDAVFQNVNKTFTVTLSGPTGGAVLGNPISAVVTLLESDGSPNQRWIAQAYLDLLQRPVDPTGLAVWTAALNGGVSRPAIARAIENSQEYRVVEVQGLYQQYLHRAADPVGLAALTGLLAAGQTVEQVAAAIVGSSEFFQTQGGGTNDGFLNALYLDALGRSVDASGRSTFDQLLASGTTRVQVAAMIFASTEYAQDLVQGFYQRFLHRTGDAAGVNFFVGLLHPSTGGATQPIFITDPSGGQVTALRDEDVIALMVGSQEYFNRLG